MRACLSAIVMAFALTAPGFALQSDDVIVVTGSRMADYESDFVPSVRLERRADAISVRVRVVCDTREEAQRLRELRDTLRNLVRAGRQSSNVAIGLLVDRNDIGDQLIVDFDETMIDSLPIGTGRGRTDTSEVVIMATTAISPEDTVDATTARINDFIENTRVVGRTEMLNTNDWELTVTGGPARYRDEIIAAIAADAHRTAAAFGDDFTIEVSGLEGGVHWQRAGAMELSLYIDYALSVRPAQ
ncbi:hypothetical protein [Maricaulis sp.]|uniref:hypothetical protein n=1 Tax=Maricaulis sp. TaxID=1486257 RepID=UPI003A8E9FA1